ncbi:CRTAC1 family protein [Marinicella sp. S1101]|uniref:CRTAC1 family protein n=1 Tax=Marinicella marina TaxID=2996016 RepID=UPI002260CE04|nr:CRTAC1 family protein [Marinicella marina]MCX7552962.1 CRTAC1 family protein [Marinicella marina]MDJ1139728.1 CRTAC1 family protein [Marinicella marina]
MKSKLTIITYFLVCSGVAQSQLFREVTVQSNLSFNHTNNADRRGEPTEIAAGGAVEDYDFDGYPDFYLVGGSDQHNALFRNQGDGRFVDVAAITNVDLFDVLSSGPVFADVDGDYDLDLLVFSINKAGQLTPNTGDSIENRVRLFINLGNGSFMESMTSGFNSGMPSFSGTLGDLDKDGDLDLFMTHWHADETTSKQLIWENDGNGQFSDVTIDYLGLSQNANFDRWTFTPNLTDINNDGWLDVLLTSDFGTSRIFYSTGLTNGDPRYIISQPPFITDENGMGAALADYDNDGDLDWFVTSIWDPNGDAEANWGISGNRLYRNTGTGSTIDGFEDATDEAGLRFGYWGWGACFADFNNDGHLDLYHENGFPNENFALEFLEDPAQLYLSTGNGAFIEAAASNGLNHTGQGRGVSCVDYDLDGDLDILMMPNDAAYRLYENINNNGNHYLGVKLFDNTSNTHAYHAKISLETASLTQTREVSGGNNYVSNNPITQHFGLGEDTTVNQLNITWPDGTAKQITNNINTNQVISVGRYCHTRFMTQAYVTATPQTVALTVHAHNLDGSPLNDKEISMSISQGPNTGVSNSDFTDSNGMAVFSVDHTSFGTDRITFELTQDNETQICKALIKWQNDILFADGFD